MPTTTTATQNYDMTFTPEEASVILGNGPTGSNTGTAPGQTPASTATPWLALAGSTLHDSSTVLVAAINGSNETERERIRNAAQTRQAELLDNMRVAIATDPNNAEALRLRVLALQQTIDALQPRTNNTLLYATIGGVAVLAVAAIVYVAMNGKRRNPRARRGKKK